MSVQSYASYLITFSIFLPQNRTAESETHKSATLIWTTVAFSDSLDTAMIRTKVRDCQIFILVKRKDHAEILLFTI